MKRQCHVYIYNTLINSNCMEGKLHKSFELFDEMRKKKTDPTIITYNILISGLWKEDIMHAQQVTFLQQCRPLMWLLICLHIMI